MHTTAAKRRLTLSDFIILVAAIAVGFALVRPALSYLEANPVKLMGGAADYAIFYSLLYGTPVLIACSLALVALSLRHPRPSMHRLIRSPGFVVNAAAILGLLVITLHYVGQTLIDPSRAAGTYMHVLSTGLPGEVGYFVIGSLLPLALSGHWRPRPSWTDRVCWLVGILWVIIALLSWSRLYLILWK